MIPITLWSIVAVVGHLLAVLTCRLRKGGSIQPSRAYSLQRVLLSYCLQIANAEM